MEPGILRRAVQNQDRQRREREDDGRRVRRGKGLGVGLPFRHKIRGHGDHLESQKIPDLGGKDDDGDPGREPDGQGIRDELDDGAETEKPHAQQKDAGNQRADDESIHPMPLDNVGHEDDVGPGRPADLDLGPSQEGDEKARDDGRHQAAVRRHARGDRKGDGEREGDNAHDDTGERVRGEEPERIVLEGR
jgi:hypothetical protein